MRGLIAAWGPLHLALDGFVLTGNRIRGYVEVRDPRRYDMPASVPNKCKGTYASGGNYSTSIMHQLHCLVCCSLHYARMWETEELIHNVLGNVQDRIDRPEWSIQL
jgi:hypothetical protein